MRPTHRTGKLFQSSWTVLHLFIFAHIQRAKGECCFESDDLDCMGAAVSGGVHYIGRGGGIFAAAAGQALHTAHFVRHGGRHHAGGQRVEPFAARH